jgi:hypothetical protein
MRAKLVARGIHAITNYMRTFPVRNPNGRLTLCTPFKTTLNAYLYMDIRPHQAQEMLEMWTPKDLHMSDRIVLYRLAPYEYHLTFEGLEAIET